MAQYIDKSALVAEIEKRLDELYSLLPDASKVENGMITILEACNTGKYTALESILSLVKEKLEVKEVGDNSLEKFKSLQHITKDLHQTLEDWGYAPNLYHFDGSWHVDWISCEEGDSIKGFTADTAEEAINEAYNWFHSTFCNG